MVVPQLTFYVDFISPYAYLAFERLPQALQGVSHAVRYQPILFGSLLQHHGTIGPAELAPKRAWTYRHVSWLAQAQGTPMQMPVSHPFNPLPLLRLALACGGERAPNRWVCETIFRHVWAEGGDPLDADRLARLVDVLKPAVDPASEAVKLQLRSATESALAAGVFGVPTVAVGDKLFWGLDALPMLRDHLDGGVWFSGSAWDDAAQVPVGLVRRR
jgi:2-hydroxychromene-2-carboxylate isomerase